MSQGILLFGHGARDPLWATPFHAVAARIRALHPGVPVELAFLELMSPDLNGGADALVEAGCDAIGIVPLFLGTGGHVRGDLPRLLEHLRLRHPKVRWALQGAIGEHPDVINAIARAACESLS
jgi:sirohydrochlorin cobaltochelatase